jgi:peptidoglycan/LPS O-acetylase OafA/YrhL
MQLNYEDLLNNPMNQTVDTREMRGSGLSDTKPHYEILDGLRGVAAVMVVAFHIFKVNSTGRFDQVINHGYLAVDFFFVLSGFVIAYAYDDCWGKMTVGQFFKRRLIRLHPMVVMGMIIGAVLFYFGDSSVFPLIHDVPVRKMLLFMLLGMLMIPALPSMDIRGWKEMYTLNAPCWSLFLEYVANILYALFIRKFSKTALSILVFIAACATIHLTVTTSGDIIGGWTFDAKHLRIGFTRLIRLPYLQVSRRHFFSVIHHSLSAYLFVLYMGTRR